MVDAKGLVVRQCELPQDQLSWLILASGDYFQAGAFTPGKLEIEIQVLSADTS